jgi:hypothetical protein
MTSEAKACLFACVKDFFLASIALVAACNVAAACISLSSAAPVKLFFAVRVLWELARESGGAEVEVDECAESTMESWGALLYEEEDRQVERSSGGDLEGEGERDIDMETVSLVLSLLMDREESELLAIAVDCNLWPFADSISCLWDPDAVPVPTPPPDIRFWPLFSLHATCNVFAASRRFT